MVLYCKLKLGKVDWAAHDIAGLLYDQVAHDEAVKLLLVAER
jgi:alkaline phosphatase